MEIHEPVWIRDREISVEVFDCFENERYAALQADDKRTRDKANALTFEANSQFRGRQIGDFHASTASIKAKECNWRSRSET